ncbi:MAG: aldehyde dehydrogenase family protein, partial [Arenicella sp.]|nr:aldehyde dehydrogenase family protein [Arenicella sp.]
MSSQHYRNYIAGQWVDSERTLDVINPATEQRVGTIALAGKDEVDAAVKAARACADASVLYNMKPAERARILQRISQELQSMAEQGVP